MADTQKPDPRISRRTAMFVIWALIALGVMLPGLISGPTRIPYSEFKEHVAAGRVTEVTIAPTLIRGLLRPAGETASAPASRTATAPAPGTAPAPVASVPAGADGRTVFEAVRVEDPKLVEQLAAAHVKVTGQADSGWLAQILAWVWPILLLLLLFGLPRMAGQAGGPGGLMAIGRSKAKLYMEKEVKVSFADVAGVDEAKEELQEVLDFLRDSGRFARIGARIPKGVLLVGPPGTGKTLLARAVAGEAGVPFFSISGSDFVEMFVGLGAARVRDLFEQAKKKAPCIVFIDELDAVGKARGTGPMAHEEREQTLNQLLVELDGFDPRTGVVLMAATNRPEILDPALLRPGRFDRHVLVDRPDRRGRLDILKVHARKVPLESEADLEAIAAGTPGFVGADLANIVNEAALLAVRRGKQTVGRAELQEAVERVVAGLEKKNRVLTPAEKERVAHHETGHALVAMLIPGSDKVHKVSIIPRGIAALGYTLHLPTEDRFLMARSELENKIAMLLGGLVAEELVFGEISTGARDDLLKATDIARSMVKAYGMSERAGHVSYDREVQPLLAPIPGMTTRGDYSEATARLIDDEVRRILGEQKARVHGLLTARLDTLRAAARELLRREVMSGDELRALLESSPELARRVPGGAA